MMMSTFFIVFLMPFQALGGASIDDNPRCREVMISNISIIGEIVLSMSVENADVFCIMEYGGDKKTTATKDDHQGESLNWPESFILRDDGISNSNLSLQCGDFDTFTYDDLIGETFASAENFHSGSPKYVHEATFHAHASTDLKKTVNITFTVECQDKHIELCSVDVLENPADGRYYSSVYDGDLRDQYDESMLYSAQAWSAISGGNDPYITIELDSLTEISGVVSQGRNQSSLVDINNPDNVFAAQWVTKILVEVSKGDGVYAVVPSGLSENLFIANNDSDTTKVNMFPAVLARRIRITIKESQGHPSMRVAFFRSEPVLCEVDSFAATYLWAIIVLCVLVAVALVVAICLAVKACIGWRAARREHDDQDGADLGPEKLDV